MRQILVQRARARHAEKRGGENAERIALDESRDRRCDASPPEPRGGVDVLALDAALEKLAALDAQQAKIVELRYFGGLTVEEAAEALDISPATVKRHWTLARAWLKQRTRRHERSAERWQRVGALFDRALATPAAERLSLVRASGEPADVQDEVLGLLKSHDDSDGFLEPPALLDPGAEVGAYRIERIIGRGGMGVVYLAHDTRLHRPVALKALPPHLFRDDRMRARLRQEARAAAALSHPSIATVYALEEIGDQIFIASEYLEGRTLREELRRGPAAARLACSTSRARSPRRCRPRTIAASCIAT